MILYTDLPPEPKLEQRVLSDEDFSKVENEDEDDDGEEEKKEEESFWSRYMRDRARSKFGVDLPSRLKVVEVKTTRVLDPSPPERSCVRCRCEGGISLASERAVSPPGPRAESGRSCSAAAPPFCRAMACARP